MLWLAGVVAVAVATPALVTLPEGFHHDIDDTLFSVSSHHACALLPRGDGSIGGKPTCWGNKQFGRLDAIDVRGCRECSLYRLV
jgi:hypothetical protein